MRICGIIIAAGLSGRMKKFKPLLDYQGKSFIERIILNLLKVCDEVILVTGYKREQIAEHLKKAGLFEQINEVHNDNYQRGMFTSLQAGLSGGKGADWILYHFVDQPNLPLKFYSDFVNQIEEKYDWIQPAYQKKKGHPVIFNNLVKERVLTAFPEDNLRELSQTIKKKIWESNYPEVLSDVDTSEDYLSLIK